MLPIFNVYDEKNNRPYNILRPKRVLSPFELTAAGTSLDPNWLKKGSNDGLALEAFETYWIRPREEPWLRGDEEKRGNAKWRVLPLICSEALQFPRSGPDNSDFDLAVFLAYNRNADPFAPEIERHSLMKIPVIFCNDGAYGGSSVTIPSDQRGDYWWSDIPNRGQLPEGDGLVVVDIDTKNLAIPRGINKVEDRLQILALPSVVPRNEAISSFRVANAMANLKRQSAASEERCRVAEQMLDSEVPTPLQARRLRRVLQLGSLNQRLWEIHADDICYGAYSDEGPPVDLAGLEVTLARQTLEYVKRQLSLRQMNADQAKATMEVRRICAERCGDREPEELERVVWSFFDRVSQRGKLAAEQQLTADIADLVVRLGATSAWLFVALPEAQDLSTENPRRHSLHLAVTHNARFEPQKIEIMNLEEKASTVSPSLVGYVAAKKKSLLYRKIIQRYGHSIPRQFRPVKSSSHSAIAVPICYEVDGQEELLGVLELESNQVNAFLPLHLKELEAESTRMISNLMILRESAPIQQDHKLTWNPRLTNWSISRVLNDFCYALGSSLSNESNEPVFGCTVWYADWKEADARAHARGAVRFDHEYLTRTLPIIAQHGKDSTSRPQPASFLGWILTQRQFFSDHWHHAPLFIRYDKAEKMELEQIIAAPILDSANDLQKGVANTPLDVLEDSDDVDTGNLLSAERVDAPPLGALSFYFYRGEDGTTKERTRDLFDQGSVERISQILSRFIDRNRLLGCRIAGAEVESRIKTGANDVHRGLHTVRKLLVEALEADGCSIFACDYEKPGAKWPKSLKCVSSTGIERDGRPVSDCDVKYQVKSLKKLRESLNGERFRASEHFAASSRQQTAKSSFGFTEKTRRLLVPS